MLRDIQDLKKGKDFINAKNCTIWDAKKLNLCCALIRGRRVMGHIYMPRLCETNFG